MSDEHGAARGRRRIGWAAGLVVAGVVGGALMMLTVPALADPSPTPSTSSTPKRPRPRR